MYTHLQVVTDMHLYEKHHLEVKTLSKFSQQALNFSLGSIVLHSSHEECHKLDSCGSKTCIKCNLTHSNLSG